MSTISVTLPTDGTTADVSDYNTPITTIVNEINGNLDNDNIKSAAAISGSKLADNSIDIGAKASTWDGWVEVSDSWTYASATTITVPSDATTKYSVGDKIKLVQTSTKYFYITAVAATTLTITGGTDYTLANAAISDVYYSKAATPLGFPQFFSYTPTFANFTVGNATLACKFSMVGRSVVVRVGVAMGNTSSMSTSPTISLPVATSSGYVVGQHIGSLRFVANATGYTGYLQYATTTTGTLVASTVTSLGAGLTDLTITSTVPNTWGTSGTIYGTAVYEAA